MLLKLFSYLIRKSKNDITNIDENHYRYKRRIILINTGPQVNTFSLHEKTEDVLQALTKDVKYQMMCAFLFLLVMTFLPQGPSNCYPNSGFDSWSRTN